MDAGQGVRGAGRKGRARWWMQGVRGSEAGQACYWMSVDPSPSGDRGLDPNVVKSFLERHNRFPVSDPARTRPRLRKHRALHWFAAGAKHLARVTLVVGIGAACIFAGRSYATHAADLLTHAVEQAKKEMKAQADARIIPAQAELQAKLDVAQQQLVEARGACGSHAARRGPAGAGAGSHACGAIAHEGPDGVGGEASGGGQVGGSQAQRKRRCPSTIPGSY